MLNMVVFALFVTSGRVAGLQSFGRDHVLRRGAVVRPHGGVTVMTGNRRLVRLAVAHLTFGVVAGLLAAIELPDPFGLAHILPPVGLRHILVVPLFASALCQALLLALWGASSKVSPWGRMAGLVAGAVYLEALFPHALTQEFFGTSTIAIAVTTVTLVVVRALGVRLTRQDDAGQPARVGTDGLRFSIRGLMLFTAAVALLSAAARALQESPNHRLMLMVVWALCFVTVGLVALWAALGNPRPLWRGPVVFALSPVLGAFFAIATHAHAAGCVYITLVMLLYPTLLLGSLLIVRSCGYRLVRPAVPFSNPPDDGGQDGYRL